MAHAAQRAFLHRYPATAGELIEIAESWLTMRDVPAVGLLVCDVFNRPLACRLIADSLGTETLVAATQFAITSCAVRAVLVVHEPTGELDQLALADAAQDFDAMLRPFDASCVDVI